MWKVKWIGILCMTAAVLSACGSEKSQGTGEVLLYENGEAASGSAVSQEDYETTTVRQETYKEEYYDTADLDYTDTETIYIDDEDAVLDSIKVKKDQKVNKGDVLAVSLRAAIRVVVIGDVVGVHPVEQHRLFQRRAARQDGRHPPHGGDRRCALFLGEPLGVGGDVIGPVVLPDGQQVLPHLVSIPQHLLPSLPAVPPGKAVRRVLVLSA